jgi:hypothetical protein
MLVGNSLTHGPSQVITWLPAAFAFFNTGTIAAGSSAATAITLGLAEMALSSISI